MSVDAERPPRLGRGLILRASLAGFLVIAATAAALSTTVILEVSRVKDIFTRKGRQSIVIPEVTRAQAGGPRTILMIGSDQRYADKKLKLKPRSDTMLLARVNPDTNAISVLSIPRDLKVDIPGHGSDKINASFELGGPRLTVRTIKGLFEKVNHDKFPINNVLVVNFGTFRRAVDYIGGVYVDVDRRYFNDNSGGQNYATIDIQPGYQELKGRDALDYVRYRHTDNDLIRAARQQDFLSQARNMAGFKKLLTVGDRDKLARAFSRYFQYDRSFTKTQEIFSMARLGLFLAQQKPAVHKIAFPAYDAPNPALDSRLYYRPAELRQVIRDFMQTRSSKAPRTVSTPSAADRATQRARRKRNKNRTVSGPGLVDARREGENMAVLADPKLNFPFYFPGLRNATGAYADDKPRLYTIRDETGKRHQAYRLVISKGLAGQYYGVQGMTWKAPPILDNPSGTRVVNGRRLQLYKDGSHIHIVSWRTRRAVYWITNTLTQGLSNDQMVAIAASLRRLKQ
ncbi:MAG: polyisoprenyl-teichoic acid--peptidoglycan teichoic acid transferase [Solirubrobacteraceae bacterium]|nr:polyisoprenyl-teichoic acid--peptidoglycan teichoic acid transferase [Solirubrobacteraceae bacterium]